MMSDLTKLQLEQRLISISALAENIQRMTKKMQRRLDLVLVNSEKIDITLHIESLASQIEFESDFRHVDGVIYIRSADVCHPKFTANKIYKASYCDSKKQLCITESDDSNAYVLLKGCHYLKGGNWEIVSAQEALHNDKS